jgi:hypothetical protein
MNPQSVACHHHAGFDSRCYIVAVSPVQLSNVAASNCRSQVGRPTGVFRMPGVTSP